MFDPKSLLDQFLGGQQGQAGQAGQGRPPQQQAGGNPLGNLGSIPGLGSLGGFGGGAAAGGLLGLFLGNKKVRKMAGGAVGYGGAAVLGAIAMRAWQNWQAGKAPEASAQPAPTAATTGESAVETRFLPQAMTGSDGTPFPLALMRAMVGAAKADGHVDGAEHQRLFAEVERQDLDADAKAFVFDLLGRTITPEEVAAAATTPEQAAELYLASRMAIDPDLPEERAYLQRLETALKLPSGLAAHLDRAVTTR